MTDLAWTVEVFQRNGNWARQLLTEHLRLNKREQVEAEKIKHHEESVLHEKEQTEAARAGDAGKGFAVVPGLQLVRVG